MTYSSIYMTQAEAIDQLFAAELQFRLASAVKLAVAIKKQPLVVPVEWVHGKHRVLNKEIALRSDQAKYAAWHLHQSATFLMAVAIKDAIKSTIANPKNHQDQNVRNAYLPSSKHRLHLMFQRSFTLGRNF